MSSRQLRKLQQQRELEQSKLQAQAAEEESEDEPILPTKPKVSLFANLAALENEEDEEEVADHDESNVLQEVQEVNEAATFPAALKKSKKSKKKKKAKNKGKENLVENVDGTDNFEDIDAVLRELDLKKSEPAPDVTSRLKVDPEYERVCALLSIGSQNLKVANEMRSLFGKEFSSIDDDEENRQNGHGVRRRQRGQLQQVDLETALKGHHAPGKGLSRLTLRRNALILGKQDWPKASTGGLSLVMVDDKADDGTIEFRFVHDQQYQTLQQVFEQCVEMGDPQNLIGLLIRNPYHISLLIQVSKIAKDQGDHALSSDLLERALFSFGRAATTVFNSKLSQGKARLDFARPENRELWLAGYHYIKSLIMKGTYRTALEWAKLLLSLDPEGDPYAMRLMIHHLALRAGEYKWLLDVGESEIPEIWAPEHAGKIHAASHTTPSLALAAVHLKQSSRCRELLSDSMKKIPWLFVRLFKEISLDAPKSIWGIMPRTDAETLFTELYVLQTKDIWNTPEVTALLMEIAHTIPKIKVDEIPRLDSREMTLDVVRFIYLDNNPAIMALAPSYLLHRNNTSDSDPLPPDINVYSYESQRHAIEGPDREHGGVFQDGYDPIAAIARFMPDFRRSPREDGDEARVLPALVDVERGDPPFIDEYPYMAESEARERTAGRGSLAGRLLRMFWWTDDDPDADEEEEEEEEEEDEDEGHNEGEQSSDEDLPELIDP
ncbi:hypothetical protein EG329_008763 [Mollisiaceae sp. DMI_Dod_QoI]|nr:hypothetical protein EG329_008763 [Helotiales sp. DMI_Dod_QoI]